MFNHQPNLRVEPSFIETKQFKRNEKELLLLSKMFQNIDCYFVEVFPKEDKNYFIT